ncbi:DUF3971 domain-containing protein [Henriciella sp.]|uniref:YhdP family protein n=1 Tax=Henriciella sp. TaxID=1968823 RepID=UPI0026140B65|nr:DUF3971 domain-containing protein [Henriciella sp.]
MVRQTATVVTFELLGGVLLLAVAAVVTLAFMLAQGPVELNMFKNDVERALEEARNGRDIEIEQLTLQWSPADRRMIVSADNLSLADDDGNIAARASQALITLDAGSLFFGRTEILRTELRDGWVNVRNVTPTLWTFAGEPLPEFEARELPQTVDGWLQLMNRVLGDILAGLETTRQEGTLEAASFERMDLRFHAADDSLIGEMTNASGAMERNEEGLFVQLAGSGTGLGLPGDIEAKLGVPVDYEALSLRLDLFEWSVGDLAARLGTFEDKISGFPADIGLGITFEAGTGLSEVSLSAEAEAGEVIFADRPQEVDSLVFDTTYDPASDVLTITDLDVASRRLTGRWTGTVSQPRSEDENSAFDLQSEKVRLDLTPYFPEPWEFENISAKGTLDLEDQLATVEAFSFNVRDAVVRGEAQIEPRPDASEQQLPLAVKLEAELEGDLPKELALRFWPRTLGSSARNFAVERINSATATAASVRLDLSPDSIQNGYFRDEDLEVRFYVEDAHVKFMNDLPPITQGSGTGRLTGNGFSVQLNSGEYGGWPLNDGSVTIPRFDSKEDRMRVYAKGAGPLVDAMRNLVNSGLIEDDEGDELDPERFSGNASMRFEMFMPVRNEIEDDEYDITLTGKVTDAGLANALPGLDLVNGEVDIQLSDARLVLTGFGDLGPAPVQFTWRDDLDDDGAPATLSASSFISPDFLNRFGVVGRAYVSGDIPVEVQALVAGSGVRSLDVSFDLQQSRVDVSELGWIKPAGEAARATLSYGEGASMTESTFQFRSQTARFDGDVRLSTNGQLQKLDVREAYVEDFIDVGGSIERQPDNTFKSMLTGDFLDLSAFFGDFGDVGGASGFSIPIELDADITTLRLRQALDLTDATLRFESTRAGVKEVIARGDIETGSGSLVATYTGPTVENPARLRLQSDDAGFIMRALLDQDFLSGGSMILSGQLARGDSPARLNMELENVRMRDAPLLTQVLSLASLRGLSDTLAGDGVLFTDVRIPITLAGDRFIIDGATANGPALGLTLNGWLGQSNDEIRVSGVLVPSFGMNSMLGGVPIIGDLFVGRDGEGIFSLTYSVRGTLDRAQVAVNPLSAVTPGILRRIFENPADTSIPDSLPTDPNRTPPAPPMPDAEFIPSAPGSASNN